MEEEEEGDLDLDDTEDGSKVRGRIQYLKMRKLSIMYKVIPKEVAFRVDIYLKIDFTLSDAGHRARSSPRALP